MSPKRLMSGAAAAIYGDTQNLQGGGRLLHVATQKINKWSSNRCMRLHIKLLDGEATAIDGGT